MLLIDRLIHGRWMRTALGGGSRTGFAVRLMFVWWCVSVIQPGPTVISSSIKNCLCREFGLWLATCTVADSTAEKLRPNRTAVFSRESSNHQHSPSATQEFPCKLAESPAKMEVIIHALHIT